jgi:AcrR family transcriptional regulator
MDVARECEAVRDPRIRRTRHGLQEALRKLLETESFEQISVLEIAEKAQVNRATFYDHYPDKFALLEALVAARFFGLLEARKIRFDGTCPSAIKALILAVCDFLTTESGLGGIAPGSSFQPLVESTIISLIRKVILDGPERGVASGGASPELTAAAVSWAIYGAAKEWADTADRVPADEISATIMLLVAPVLGFQTGLQEPEPLLN